VMWHTNKRTKDPLRDKKLALIGAIAAKKYIPSEVRMETVAVLGEFKIISDMNEAEIDAMLAHLRQEEARTA
jgi:hypothetical protein